MLAWNLWTSLCCKQEMALVLSFKPLLWGFHPETFVPKQGSLKSRHQNQRHLRYALSSWIFPTTSGSANIVTLPATAFAQQLLDWLLGTVRSPEDPPQQAFTKHLMTRKPLILANTSRRTSTLSKTSWLMPTELAQYGSVQQKSQIPPWAFSSHKQRFSWGTKASNIVKHWILESWNCNGIHSVRSLCQIRWDLWTGIV